jgi:8-oxo-dGTP pyrophosphatase MutT (NUDIX family)
MEGHVLAAARPGVGRAAKSAEAAHLGVGDHLSKRGADRRVEGVAAARQELSPNFRRQRLRRYHYPSHLRNVIRHHPYTLDSERQIDVASGAGRRTLSATSVAVPRPSASVILVRDGPPGLQTFMVRRHVRSPVAPSAYVFPGGTVRADDLSYVVADTALLADALSSRSDVEVPAREAAALYVCAVRELFEEAGVFLVRRADGALLNVAESDTALQERLESTRLALQARELTITQVLEANALLPAFDLLVPFSHWITPRALATRFDTRFFVAELPAGQSALHDTIETSEGVWLTASEALAVDYHTVFATAHHLRRLLPYRSVAELLEFARAKPIRAVQPEVAESGEGMRAFVPSSIADSW